MSCHNYPLTSSASDGGCSRKVDNNNQPKIWTNHSTELSPEFLLYFWKQQEEDSFHHHAVD
jgi:hypothetical protein